MEDSIIGNFQNKIEKISDTLFKIGPLGDPKILCSYLVLDEKVGVIDCGPSVAIEELLSIVNRIGINNREIDYLFLTHVHVDHAGGTAKFLKGCPNAFAYVPERGYKHLLYPSILNSSAMKILGSEIFDYWGLVDPVPKERLRPIYPEESIPIGRTSIRYVSATGHAPHHCVLHEEKKSITFAADSLGIVDEAFGLICPTSPPPAFDYDQAIIDIRKVQGLKSSLLCLPHFKTIKPESSFFKKVSELYENWKRIITQFIASKTKLDEEETNELCSILESEYPVYGKVGKDMKLQIRRVHVPGLAQWILRRKSLKSHE